MIIGVAFLILGVWQLWMTKRSFTSLKKSGNQNTSSFVMVSLWSSLVMAIIFLALAFNFFTGNIGF